MHDVAYRDDGTSTEATNGEEELTTFLRLAKETGYIFSTLDRYLHDPV